MPDQELPHGHERRRIQFVELWTPRDWTIKVYAIAKRSREPDPDLIAVAKDLGFQRLPFPASTETRYGLGLVTVQEGEHRDFIRIGWWVRRHFFKSYLYSSDPGRSEPELFSDLTSTGLSASLWDLHVMQFESSAWISSVLEREGGPNLDEYLAQRVRREL